MYLYTNINNDKQIINDKINNHLKSTIYLSYKYNFRMNDNNNKIISTDAGWGCMIRVG